MKWFRILFIILLPAITFGQLDSLRGPVKSVREKVIFLNQKQQNTKLFFTEGDYGHYGFQSPESTFSLFNSWWFHTPLMHYLNYYREYDRQGNLLSDTWYYKNDTAFRFYRYQYDAQNNLVEKTDSLSVGLKNTRRMSYASGNRLISLTQSSEKFKLGKDTVAATLLIQENRFDASGRLIEIKNKIGSMDGSVFKYTYDAAGHKLSDSLYTPYDWVKTGEYTTTYMKNGVGRKHLEKEFIYEGNHLIKDKTYQYDEDEKRDRLTSVVSYTYDEKGRKATESYGIDSISHYKTFLYDEQNNLLEVLTLNGKSSIPGLSVKYQYRDGSPVKVIYTENGVSATLEFTYTFDKYKNWTTQTKSINGKPLFLRSRTLTYY